MDNELVTYAKVMGLARTTGDDRFFDDDGLPAFGYVKLEGVKLQKDTLARLLHTTPDTIVMLTKEEYEAEMEGGDD